MTKLAAGMITFNEVDRYQPLVIRHLREFCDLIVAVDDGSTDETREWLRDNADDQLQVHFDRRRAHQGQSRGRLLELVHKSGATHQLACDADELIADGPRLRALVEERPNVSVWSLEISEVWNPLPDGLQIREDGGWRMHPLSSLWRVPPRLGGNWKMRDRARACRRYPIAVDTIRAEATNIHHLHFGWADKSERQRRFDNYMRIDAGRFHARSHLASIQWPEARMKFVTIPWPEGATFDELRERFTMVPA